MSAVPVGQSESQPSAAALESGTPAGLRGGPVATEEYAEARSRRLLAAIVAFRDGDFSVRLPTDWAGTDGRIAEAFNQVVALEDRIAREVARVSQTVGKEGRLKQRMSVPGAVGNWAAKVASLNTLLDDLVRPTADVARTIGAVAKGDLGQSLELEVDGHPLQGEFLRSANLVNTMILQDPLGVGAIRYGQRLLEKGLYDQAVRLMKRLLAWGREDSIETYIILGRGHVGLGDYQEATALVTGLFQQQKYSVGVALLGLELGLAEGRSGLVEGAVSTLRPLAGGLFPDQVASLSQMLIDNGLHNELLEIFEPEIRELPAVRPALRSLARAAKATGDFEEADLLLARLDDEESLRDRFLLLTFQGRSEEASRRLRLEFTRSEDRDEVEVCQLVANALAGVTEAWFRQRFFGLKRKQTLYDITEEELAYAWGNFKGLPEFFARAARARRAVIFTVDN